MGRLGGKSAIVTGGASGFGAGIVRRFVDEGARVVIADIGDASVIAAETGAHAIACDVSDNASVAAMIAGAVEAIGDIDILVNNAGIFTGRAALEDVSEADFDRTLAVNAKSIYLTARHAIPRMKARGGGVILNIASTAGVSPRPMLGWYNASKGFVITATRTMAVELAPHGIRVNAINPVAGETPLLPTFMGGDGDAARAAFLRTIPIGRFSTAEDIAAAAVYLCSDEASMVTGVAMEVDGGRCI